jgi:hypothetical protein
VSCGPCLGVAYSRRRKKDAARDRKNKEAELALRPNLYAHPGPAEMNEHWREDMDLGPFPARKRPRKGTRDSQGKPSGKQASLASFDSTREAGIIHDPSEIPLGGVGKKRYRRADEELSWTIKEETGPNPRTREKTGADYRMLRAPPVNDMHPPVVSMIPLKPEDRRWMTEPPPSSDFLNGLIGVTIVERTESWRTKARDDHRLASKSKSVNSTDSLKKSDDVINPVIMTPGNASNVVRVKKTSSDRLNTPISRPDSAVSTGRRMRYRPASSRLHPESSTASSSDGDDEDNGHLPTRPRAVYRADAQPSRRRSRRAHLAGVADQDFAVSSARNSTHTPQFSPALRPQSMNSENVSPRASPRSAASMASPFSSEDEGLPSPRIRPVRAKAHPPTAVALPSHLLTTRTYLQANPEVKRSSSLRPFLLKPSRSYTERDTHPTPGAEELTEIISGLKIREANSSIDLGTVDIEHMLEWKQLSEKAAKEQMWLGPPPVRSETYMMEKRHSTDF